MGLTLTAEGCVTSPLVPPRLVPPLRAEETHKAGTYSTGLLGAFQGSCIRPDIEMEEGRKNSMIHPLSAVSELVRGVEPWHRFGGF